MTLQKKESDLTANNQLDLYQKQAIIYAKELAQIYKKEKNVSAILKEKVAAVNKAYKQSFIYAEEITILRGQVIRARIDTSLYEQVMQNIKNKKIPPEKSVEEPRNPFLPYKAGVEAGEDE